MKERETDSVHKSGSSKKGRKLRKEEVLRGHNNCGYKLGYIAKEMETHK